MHKRKGAASLGLSLVLAAGMITSPAAAADFTDGTVYSADIEDTADTLAEQIESGDADTEDTTGTEFSSGSEETPEFESGDDSESNAQIATEELPDGTVSVTESMIPDTDNTMDNKQLLEEYLNSILYEQDLSVQPGTSVAEDALSGVQQSLYEELKNKITTVASKGGSTKFNISSDLGLTWQTTATGSALSREVSKHFGTLETSKIINCLTVDCPYEMYWYEKTASTIWQYGYTTSTSGGRTTVKITNISVSMPVIRTYASGDYKVNAKIVQLAKQAAANAKMIVQEFSSYTEDEKLIGYKEIICYLTSYNDDVTDWDEYGDPWQLIYVFDGDDSTNVVCEGYSKAFQYLCDLSDITCYTVTGMMSGGTGAGPHMWNIVANDGKYYMADITNSDEGTVGADGGLFLDTPISGSVAKGYIYATDSVNMHYTYDTETKKLYGTGKNSVLQMTQESYSADSLTAKPAKTTITGISNKTAGKLVLNWKKSKGAKGYEIYRRAGTTNSYVRAAVIKSGSTTKYTNAKLKKGHTYYYRIRSYAYDKNGKKIYSSWSTVKSQKVK